MNTKSAAKTAAAKSTPEAPTAKVAATPTKCRCECGANTVRPEARYLAGHDARRAGQLGRKVASGELTEAALVDAFKDEPKLLAKAQNVVATANRKAAEKAARQAAREAAKAAFEAALAGA